MKATWLNGHIYRRYLTAFRMGRRPQAKLKMRCLKSEGRRLLLFLLVVVAMLNIVLPISKAPVQTTLHVENNGPQLLNEFPQTDVFFWRRISSTISVFSAYYDDRAVHPGPRVDILGFEKQPDTSTTYHCLLYYKNKTSCEIKSSKLRVLVTDHWQSDGIPLYRPFSLTCPLPTPEIPERVAISPRKVCVNYPPKQSIEVIPVVNRKGIEKKDFVVCVCSPVFLVRDENNFIAYFEMNRLLGAGFFTVYVYSLPKKILGILRRYSQDGLAEVVENWADGMPQPVHYYGQLLSISDCLYKNIHKAKYLVYADLDEIIMPLRHPSWFALMEAVDKPTQGAFLFENTYFYSTQGKKTFTRQCNGSGSSVSFSSPIFINFKTHSRPFLGSKHTKYITKTAVTLVSQIHRVERLGRGYKSDIVPFDQALMYHFRVPYRNPVDPNKTRDNVMDKYHGALLTAITKRLCRRR